MHAVSRRHLHDLDAQHGAPRVVLRDAPDDGSTLLLVSLNGMNVCGSALGKVHLHLAQERRVGKIDLDKHLHVLCEPVERSARVDHDLPQLVEPREVAGVGPGLHPGLRGMPRAGGTDFASWMPIAAAFICPMISIPCSTNLAKLSRSTLLSHATGTTMAPAGSCTSLMAKRNRG